MSRPFPALLALALAVGCQTPVEQDATCANDALCPEGTICAFGTCVDPSDQRLASVDIEIDTSNALPVQTVFNVDLRASPRVDVLLASGVVITGSVTDGTAPVDAVVIAQPQKAVAGRVIAPSATTDVTGAFTLLAIAGERYALTVSPSALPPRYDIPLDVDDDDDVQTLEPLLVDEGTIVISGSIVAGVGAAESGVDGLDVHVKDGDGRRLSATTRTRGGGEGVRGSFELLLREGGEDLTLEVAPTVDNAGYPTVMVPLGAIDASVDVGELTLEGDAGAVLTPVPFAARIVDAAGDAAPGATLSIRGFIGRGELTAVLRADQDGIVAGTLPPAVYQAVIYGDPQSASGGFLVVDELDVPSTNAELVLALPPRVRFRGTVLDPDGAPLPGATLTVNRIGDVDGQREEVLADALISFTGVSNAAGQFDLAVDPGQYRVSTRPPAGRNAPAFSQVERVSPGGLDRDIALPGRAFVAGTVVFAGAPVGAAYIRVFSGFIDERGAAILVGEGFADAAGAFEIVVPDIVASVSSPDPP